MQQTAVQNHTATMIEIGTNLLSQTAEQTRKLTNVEAQVGLSPHDNPEQQHEKQRRVEVEAHHRVSCLCVQSYTFTEQINKI